MAFIATVHALKPIPADIATAETVHPGVARCTTTCACCALRELCLPCGLHGQHENAAEELVFTRRKIKRGDHLFYTGDKFTSLYAVRSGSFMTRLLMQDGRDQITGFQLPGEILGVDGIAAETHTCDAIAIEDSEICAIPFHRLQDMSLDVSGLQRWLHKVMSSAIVREHSVMLLLGSMRAEERVATFLLNLSQRFAARGFSAIEFNMRMTREEIGSFLGLKLETVSRIFSRFHEQGLVEIHLKHVRIVDLAGLKAIINGVTATQ